MQKFAIRLILFLSILFFATQNSIADTYPKREMRSAWITPINGNWPLSAERGTSSSLIQKQKDHAIAIIEEMKASGFNAIIIHARPYSDRMYSKTSYTHNGTEYTISEPFSHYVSGTRGTEPSNYDPLAFWVEECHKRGMECHAWINPLRFCNTTGNVTKPGWPCNSLSIDTETWNNDWLIYQYQEEDNVTKFCFDPSVAGVRERINNACIIIAGNYDVDGIVWDDYFYPNNIPEDATAGDYKRYQAYISNGGTMSMADWRRENCNTMIREAYNSIKSIKPYIKFGLAPAGAGGGNPRNCAFTSQEKNEISVLNGSVDVNVTWSDWQYNTIYADLIAWLREGTIDYISPQLYWSSNHNTNPFGSMCLWWQEVSSYFGRHCYPSNGFSGGYVNNGNGQEDWDEIVSQIETTRNVAISKAPGSIVYPASFFDPYISDSYNSGLAANTLYSNVYQKKALVPATTWYNATNPGKPQNVELSSGVLSWTSTTMSEGSVSNIGMRYAVYAIPLNIGINDAKSTIHLTDGGFKSDYLLDLTYSNSFDVSSYPESSYWYAVTIVDRFGYEWEAATINAPNLGDVQLTLNEPTSSSELSFGDNTFSWTSDGTSFTFQISTSEDFTTPLIEEVVTTNSITISTENFSDGVTYYWRVIASKENYNSAWSEIRSFTMETRPTITITLLTPENTGTIDAETIQFSWEGVEGANYTLEIAEYSSFNNILISKTTTETNIEIPTSSLAGGKTYFWHIKASCDGYQSATSDYYSFITPKVEGELVDGISISKSWEYSINKNNFYSELSSCVSPRTMAAYNGNVYILERDGDKKCYLLKFNGETGAYEDKIQLSGDCYETEDGKTLNFPCNSIFVDGAGNLCVASMTTSITNTPLIVCTVDIDNKTTTRVFESPETNASYRIDYANAYGDLTAADGQIWAATTTDNVYRWTRNADGSWTEETTTISDFYPTSATALSTAPYIQPISETQFIVDGAATHPTLYTFNGGGTATLNGSFADKADIQPAIATYNGTCSITIGSTPLFVYVDNIHSFSIVANKHDFDFSQFQFMGSVPEDKLGSTSHSWNLDQTVAINNADGSVTLFLYAPLNGLAAYRISLPNAPISLTSPINGSATQQGFDFTWNSINGSTYTIEISSSESFENIEFSATTDANSYSSTNFSLANETKYYWRVKVANDNYTTTTSAAGQFISPQKPTMPAPLLFVPLNNNTISSDISFVAKKSYILDGENKLYTTKTTLEISKTPDFSEIFFEGYSNWKEESSQNSNYEIWLQYTVPITYFANGTYYWRVKAESIDPELEDGVSEVRQFTVEGQSEAPGSAETDYTPRHENNYEYELVKSGSNYYTLTNLWIRNSEKSNIDWWNSSTSTNYRGFCTRYDHNGDQEGKDIIWIAHHDGSTAGYLEKYNAANGEYLGSIKLTGGIKTKTYPCNDVFVDDGGNLCIMNLKGTGDDLEIAIVDLSTFDASTNTVEATPFITLSVANQRIDHANIIGDITSGDAYIFGTNNATMVYRWNLYDGKLVESLENSITSFYPSSKYVTSTGTATRIYPITKDYFYTDGAGSAFTLYKFNETGTNATLNSSFALYEGTAIAPSGNFGNGGTFFIHDGVPFIVYNSSSFASNSPAVDDINYKYNIAKVADLTDWSTVSKYWTIPNDDIGKIANTGKDFGMLASYLQYDALTGAPKNNTATYSVSGYDRTNIYIYVPGNGMAAYTLTRHIYTGAEDIDANSINININHNDITFDHNVENAQIYTLSGMLLNSIEDASSIEKPASKGVYILRLTINGIITTHKIVI